MLGKFAYAENRDNMMNNKGMMKMMDAMQSPEGQKVMKVYGQIKESDNHGEMK